MSANMSWCAVMLLGVSAIAGCRDGGRETVHRDATKGAAASAPAAAPAATSSAAASTTPAAEKPLTPSREKLATDRIRVRRLVLAAGVQNREPVDAAASFDAGRDRIYAFVEVENADRNESAIFVNFVAPKGAVHGPIELDVGAAPRWRTWAYTRAAKQPGKWTVVVEDRRGRVLAETEFEVAPADPYGEVSVRAEPGA